MFEHIRTICGAYRLAVANMTHIPTTHITVSFIYHYTYNKANSKDREWRWIIGKDSNFNVPLDDFIARDETLYHYIINNNIDSAFYNDKKQASEDCKYYFSSKDNLHEREGSIVATKFSFSSNAEKCCEGIIMITTYGQKFIRDDSEHTPKEFEQLLEHEIFPCYKNLLKVELGTLYFRHKTEKESCSIEKVVKSWLDKNR